MTSVWRRIQQSGKKSAKYRFTITPQELLIVGSTKWQPQNVALACMHRRRRVEGRVRKWEGSMTDPCRALIVWPTQTPDPLHFDTTLYCDDDSPHHYTDKEWTLLVEECTRKGKRRAIAAVNLNMPLFVQNPGTIAELKIKLRPLWPELSQCSMQILISSMLISEEETNDFDAKSEASSVNGGQKATSIAGDVAETEQRANSVRIDNTIVTSYSVNLNEVERRKMSEENWAEEALKIDDTMRSNGIVDMREKFVDHLCNKSAEKDTKAVNGAGQRKPVPVMEVKEITAENSETQDEPRTMVNSAISQQTPKLSDAAKADAIDAAFQMKALNETPKVSLEEKAKTLPAVDEEEDLLSWCQRVTKDYHSVKITDFTKSFRSGLAFCAIIHRYRPDLIGPFSKLDFADSHSNRHENCRKAFDAAILVGVEKKLDPGMTVTLPDRNEIRSFLSELRMRLVDIPAIKREMSVKESDHRISALFDLSESETSVMKELESLRREREREEAIDLTNVPDEDRTKFSAVVRGSGKAENIEKGAQRRARKLANPFDSDSDEADAGKCTAHISVAPPSSSTVVVTDANDDVVAISPMVTARHEELMKKRQQIAAVPPLNDASLDTVERDRRHREEARRLMNDAALDGATLLLGGSAPTTAHHSPAVATTSGLLRKLSEATSEEGGRSNLRTLEVVIPTVNIYSFKKIQPSPIFQRKIYEAPLIAAFERPTQRLSNSNADVRKNSLGVTLDRAKRYGSMRGQELAETVAKVAGRAFTPSLVPSEASVSATPTRKLISQWEKDGADLTKIQAELNRLSKCLLQVSAEDETICAQLMKTEVSSEEEERLLQEHMRLLTEKDAIVRRTEYFNVLEQLREVEDEITKLQHELGSASSIGQDDKTEEDKQRIDKMMDDLVALVNKKDRLSQKLISHEAEDEEMGERDRLTLEAAANFSRGSEQPLSASKRLITWIRSEISS